MIRNLLIAIFKKLGFAVKFTRLGGTRKYKINSDKEGLSLYDTPTGKFYLPLYLKDDHVANTIKKGLCFEEEIVEVAKKYFKKGTAVLDIGANYGQMSVILSKHIASIGAGKIYSFEAEPFVGQVLKNNIEINNCKNVEIILGAVYHKSGEKVVFPEPDFKRFSAYGSYGIDPLAKSGRTIETITIDSLQIKEPVSFVKVDIQGSDLFALQGAKETILKNKPVIIFEYEEQFQEEFKTSFNDYVEFVKSINYKFVKTYMNINYLIAPDN
jgi:FkbM family methyltransferase